MEETSSMHGEKNAYIVCSINPLARDADPSTSSIAVVKKEWRYTSTPPMGCTACTEPQCL